MENYFKSKNMKTLFCALIFLVLPFCANAEVSPEKLVVMRAIDSNGIGKIIGILKLKNTADGLKVTADIAELSPGAHGFHLHQFPHCEAGTKDGKQVAGLAAGGHYDPNGTNQHAGPHGSGHVGDLAMLMVAADGGSEQTIDAPQLNIEAVINHSFVIHANADNYSDMPAPLGGSGARVACGVVE